MNLLFDETVAVEYQRRFALHHPDEVVSSVSMMGWGAKSGVMEGLTASQRDKLLLQLARKSGFTLFVTADIRFDRAHPPPLFLIIGNAGDYAPTLDFWNALTPALEEQIALLTQLESQEKSLIVLRAPEYEPGAAKPISGSRLASAQLRPIRER